MQKTRILKYAFSGRFEFWWIFGFSLVYKIVATFHLFCHSGETELVIMLHDREAACADIRTENNIYEETQ